MDRIARAMCVTFMACTAVLTGQTISVTVPAGGESWETGRKYTIRWTHSGKMADTVKIVLLAGGAWAADIVDSTDNDGSCGWTIPAAVRPGTYVVRVKTTDNAIMATSKAFAILPATAAEPVIEKVTPAQAEAGTEIVLKGKNFAVNNAWRVSLLGSASCTTAQIKSNNDSQITAEIPKNLSPGEWRISLTLNACDGKKISNEVPFIILPLREADMAATNCGFYDKETFTAGEKAVLALFTVNHGPANIKKYKLTAWSIMGPPAAFNVKGKSSAEQIVSYDLDPKGNDTKHDAIEVEIKDSQPGVYTMNISVQPLDPADIRDAQPENNLCQLPFQIRLPLQAPPLPPPLQLQEPLSPRIINILLPDLVVEKIALSPATPKIGDRITFTVTIANHGSGDASVRSTTWFAHHSCVFGYIDTPPVKAGEKVDVSWTNTEELRTLGIIFARADYSGQVPESNEENNDLELRYPYQ